MKLGICAPSAPAICTPDDVAKLEAGLAALRALGHQLVIAPHCQQVLDYRSATAVERVADLHQLYADPSIEAIMATNGGRVAGQLLSYLDFALIKAKPKPLVGFSDMTVLQNAILAKTGVAGIHGPLVKYFPDDPLTLNSFHASLEQQPQTFRLTDFGLWMKGDALTGTILGGSLSTVVTLLGTPYAPDWRNAVFMWEKTTEHISTVDRILTQFKNAGVWDQIAGMVIGHLEKITTDYRGTNRDVWEMITDHFSSYDFPILHTELFGHDVPTQLSFPIGGNFTANRSTVTWR